MHDIQITITLFTLTMAALMIPGSKLTDIWGRKFCLVIGLIVYGLGALIAALAPALGLLIFGYSLREGSRKNIPKEPSSGQALSQQ